MDAGQPGNPSVIPNVFGVWRDNVGWEIGREILRDSGPGRAGSRSGVLHYSLHSQTLNAIHKKCPLQTFIVHQCVNMRFLRWGKKFSCVFKKGIIL